MNAPRRFVITGTGLLSALGVGTEKNWQALLAGKSGISPISRFDTKKQSTTIAGEMKDFSAEDYLDRREARRMDPFNHYALVAAELAMNESQMPIGLEKANGYDPERVGVIVGSGIGGLASFEDSYLTGHTKVAAPIAAFAGLAWLAYRRVWDRTNLLARTIIGGLSLLWLALEIRRAFHGADLSAGAIGGAESLALSLAALAVAMSLFSVREMFTAGERAVAILLSTAIFAKIAFIDLHLPADDWRAASFTSLALALAFILAPRSEVTGRARAWP